jgi:hypothetical protein
MQMTAQLGQYGSASLNVKYLIEAARLGLKFGVEEGAQYFESEAKMLVPVDTGNLQEHIHTEVVTDTPTRQVRLVTPVVESGNEYGFDPAYARRIELGFYGPDKLGRVYNHAPQPYMRPAFDAKEDDARTAIKQSVLDELAAASSAVAGRRNR